MPYHDHMHQPHCEFSTRGWEGWWWWCIWSANWTMQSPLSPLELWWRVQEHPVLYWWRVHWTAMVNCARRIMSTVLKVALKSHCTMVKRARRTTSRVLKIALRAFLLYSIHVNHTICTPPWSLQQQPSPITLPVPISHHTTNTHITLQQYSTITTHKSHQHHTISTNGMCETSVICYYLCDQFGRRSSIPNIPSTTSTRPLWKKYVRYVTSMPF